MDPSVIHVVDDDESFRKAIGRVLDGAGYRVVQHPSAQSVLAALPGMERGCILLDVQLPLLSGPQLQERLGRTRL